MRTISRLLVFALLLASPGGAWALSRWSCISNTTTGYALASGRAAYKCTVTMTADGSGDSSGTQTINGWVVRVVVNPDGSAVPTTGYDIYLTDEDGIDVLGGDGVGLAIAGGGADSDSVEINPDPIRWVDGTLNAVGDDMGSAAVAKLIVYVLR